MRRRPSFLSTVALGLALGCSTNYRAEFQPAPGSDPGSTDPTAVAATPTAAFVKLHTHTGEVYVLDGWRFDEDARRVHGTGIHYSAEREPLARGEVELGYDEVALVETNTPERITHATSLAIMGVVGATAFGGVLLCAANPKACFGSCPTFYVHDGDALELRAEGFSSAVAAALEERDVDHLGVVDPVGGRFELVMANEAFETHFLRRVELLSVARPSPEVAVFHTREGFVGVRDRVAPSGCRSRAGDCLAAVVGADADEYGSSASPENLAEREHIELEFPAALDRGSAGERALVIRARNSLLDTFLFYQGLAYMGEELPRWILRADHEGPDGLFVSLLRGFDRELGDIEVEVWDGQGWRAAGSFREYGPIAHETQVVTLPPVAGAGPVRVRLELTRGRWKLDSVELGAAVGRLSAVAVSPDRVGRAGAEDPAALARLLDPEARLLSYPGDVWTLGFALPDGPQALFLAAEGYYWEWPREDWLPEQSAVAAARFFADPAATLRRLAPIYAAMESELAPVFWETRIRPLPLAGARAPAVGR